MLAVNSMAVALTNNEYVITIAIAAVAVIAMLCAIKAVLSMLGKLFELIFELLAEAFKLLGVLAALVAGIGAICYITSMIII